MRRRRHQTHHKHSSKKGYRRLLDRLAAHEDVHRVATGRVKPRMGAGRPIAPISKIREIESGLSITINTDGAVIDAYVVTSDPARVAAWLRDEGPRAVIERPVCLIANPSAGGGRTAKLLPAVESALRGHGIAFRVERTHSLEHARELARATVAAGEIAAAMGGDGLLGALAGELRAHGRRAGRAARRPRQRLRAQARRRQRPRGGVRRARARPRAAPRRRRHQRPRLPRHRLLGPRLRRRRPRQRDASCAKLGQLVYLYATLRAVRAWRPARWEVVIDGEPRSFVGYSVAVCNSGVFGGGMFLAPDAELDDGMLDVVTIGDVSKRKYLGVAARRCSTGHTCASRASSSCRRREVAFHADRPFNVQADGDPIADLPATVRVQPGALRVLVPVSLLAPKVAAAKAVGALARRAGRGGGTSLPGKLLTRLEPHAIGLLAGRLEHGSVVISATNGKTTTAAMVASILERTGRRLVHNRAGANMAGGVASALADASRRGGRVLDGDLGLFEVDEFWLGEVVAELNPRAMLLANLFRDQLDRYGELDTIADRWAAVAAGRAASTQLVLNADDPLVADLGRDGRSGAVVLRRRGRRASPTSELQHASDSKHCRRCGHAYVYDAAYMGHLGRYHCPNCGNRRPEPAVRRRVGRSCAASARRAFTLRTPQGSTRVELPLPGLYNVYNALGAAALCLSLGVELPTIAAGLGAVAPAFGRAETLELDGRADLDPAGQEPRGRQRGPAHARARGRRARPASASSTTASPTAATSRGCGTPTGRRSPRTSSA